MSGRTVEIVYFSWIRERTGRSREQVAIPETVETVSDLMAWLARRGPEFAHAFAAPEAVCAALDHVHAKPAARIASAREIAFFPPVTGG